MTMLNSIVATTVEAPLVIGAIFKNEALYLKEWIEFHLLVGVEKFYLYNNNSNDNYLEVLQPYIQTGVVDLTEWPMQIPSQLQAYDHLIKRLNRRKVWCAFIDCDEFLFSPSGSIKDLLSRITKPCAIGVNWMCFGSSDKDEYENIPVIERFTWRLKQDIQANTHIKSIIRLDQTVNVGRDPHFFHAENGTYNELGAAISGPFSSPVTSNYLRINHYCTKSKAEWVIRANKGKADNPGFRFDWKYFNDIQGHDVQDFDIQNKFLEQLKTKLQ